MEEAVLIGIFSFQSNYQILFGCTFPPFVVTEILKKHIFSTSCFTQALPVLPVPILNNNGVPAVEAPIQSKLMVEHLDPIPTVEQPVEALIPGKPLAEQLEAQRVQVPLGRSLPTQGYHIVSKEATLKLKPYKLAMLMSH